MHKVLITGATGFIGQHLLECLINDKFELSILTRNTSKHLRALPVNTRILNADLTHFDSLVEAFKNVDTIVNIAAEVRNAQQMVSTNIAGTENLIKAASHNNVKKIIHISSVGVVGANYNRTHTVVDENTICKPTNDYERSKLASENLLIEASGKNLFHLDVLRPTNVFGEYHPFNALLHLMKHISSRKPVASSTDAVVNYVYVKDLAHLIRELLITGKTIGVVNVGHPILLSQFYNELSKLLNTKTWMFRLPSVLPHVLGVFHIHSFDAVFSRVEYSDRKLTKEFGYTYGLIAGLERTIEFYRSNKLL